MLLLYLGADLREQLWKKASTECIIKWPHWLENCQMLTVSVQLTQVKDPPLGEDINEKFHCHTRKEFIMQKWNEPFGDFEVENLFSEASNNAERIKNKNIRMIQRNIVGIIGQPGVGKSTLTKTILQKVVENKLPEYDVDYIFLVKLRDCQYDTKIDLLTFLTCDSLTLQYCGDERRRRAVLEQLDKTEKVLILLDGLDEAAFTGNSKCANLYSHALPEVFIKQIMLGSILPKSKKIITSRPKQFYELSDEIRPSFVVNLTGIDRSAQQQLCKCICGQESDLIFETISGEQPDLLSYCFVPVLCSLVMHCMKCLHQTHGRNTPKTISNVFVLVLCLFLKDTSHCIVEPRVANIAKIDFQYYLNHFASLAWKLFEKKEYYFDSCELDSIGFGKNEKLGFLDVILAQGKRASIVGGRPQKLFYFTHLLWQELFVALFFIKSHFKQFEKYISKYLNLNESRMEVVNNLLFGLCNEENRKFLSDDFLLTIPVKNVERLKKWVLDKLNDLEDSMKWEFYKWQTLLTWVHEMNDDFFSRNVAEKLPDIIIIRNVFNPKERYIHPMDIAILHHVFNWRQKLLGHRPGFTINLNEVIFMKDSLKRFLNEIKRASQTKAIAKVKQRIKATN